MDGCAFDNATPVARPRTLRESVAPHTEVLVAGLRWDTAAQGAGTDLDLSCALLGADLRVLETVTPRRPRNDNASVVHTGDSTNGAGAWDDERLFVFLDEVPLSVRAIMLVVASVTGEPLARIPNASCHVSDHESEELFLEYPLSRAIERPVHCVASIVRRHAGWDVVPGSPDEARAGRILRSLGMASFSKAHAAA